MVLRSVLRKILRKKKRKKERKPSSKEHKVLKSWEDMFSELQDHPLTQAKLLNEQLFQTTNDAIKNISEKLDSIDERVSRLEKNRIRKVKSKKSDNKSEDEITSATSRGQLSDQEAAMIELIEKQGEVDAQTVSSKFNISRGNASLKLNKLYNWGFLTKRLDEKSVFFSLK